VTIESTALLARVYTLPVNGSKELHMIHL